MRLLHTSDWHLGRAFHGHGLLPTQEVVLRHLVRTAVEQQADAVLVSGDVYDRAIPSPDAVALLSSVVTDLATSGIQVILTHGNHDSAVRLGFGAHLLERAGVHIRSDVADVGRPVAVADGLVFPLPYLDPASTTVTGLLEVDQHTHTAVLTAAMDRVREAAGGVGNVAVMAHCFVATGATSESERDISQGGVAAVPPEVFAGVDYAALGHLHRHQRVGEALVYSGAPYAMSFSEASDCKGYLIVDVSASGVRQEFVAAPVTRPLVRISAPLREVLASALPSNAWVQVTLTDAIRPVGAFDQLKQRFPHLLNLAFAPQGAIAAADNFPRVARRRSAHRVCLDFVEVVRAGAGATPSESALLRAALGHASSAPGLERTTSARQVPVEGEVGAA